MRAPSRTPRGGWSPKHEQQARDAGYPSWTTWIAAIEEDEDRKICGARANSTQAPCRRQPLRDRARCSRHGGKALRGQDHPAYVHGQQARYIPEALLEDFKEAYGNPEYALLRRQISINAAYENELLRQVETGEGFAAWARLKCVMADLIEVLDADTPEDVRRLVARASDLVSQGVNLRQKMTELRQCQEHGRKLKATEAQIKKDLGAMLSKDRAVALMLWLVGVVREHIDDPAALAEISSAIRSRITSGEGR